MIFYWQVLCGQDRDVKTGSFQWITQHGDNKASQLLFVTQKTRWRFFIWNLTISFKLELSIRITKRWIHICINVFFLCYGVWDAFCLCRPCIVAWWFWGQPHMKQSVAINTDNVTWKCVIYFKEIKFHLQLQLTFPNSFL